MIVHHVATIGLMVMSWSGNMIRVGTLVLGVHDAVDYLLEASTKLKSSIIVCVFYQNVLFILIVMYYILIFVDFYILANVSALFLVQFEE